MPTTIRYHDIPGYDVSFPGITSLIALYAEYKLIDTFIPKSEKRAGIGTKASQLLDRILKGGHIDDKEWYNLDLKTQSAVIAALRWQKDTKFKSKESESLVYSLRFGIAGHPDTIGIIRPWWISVIDWKIGDINNIRVKLQVPTYGFCYLEMHPRRRIDGFRAVHLDTEKATYQELIMTYKEGQYYFDEFIRMKMEVGIL
jgi:hypothetical protein